VLLKGVRIGNLYKIQGSTISDGCNSSIVPKIGSEEEKTPTISWMEGLEHCLVLFTSQYWKQI
jgi:hypothetical protein